MDGRVKDIELKLDRNIPIGGSYQDEQSPLTFREVYYLLGEIEKTTRFKRELTKFFE